MATMTKNIISSEPKRYKLHDVFLLEYIFGNHYDREYQRPTNVISDYEEYPAAGQFKFLIRYGYTSGKIEELHAYFPLVERYDISVLSADRIKIHCFGKPFLESKHESF